MILSGSNTISHKCRQMCSLCPSVLIVLKTPPFQKALADVLVSPIIGTARVCRNQNFSASQEYRTRKPIPCSEK